MFKLGLLFSLFSLSIFGFSQCENLTSTEIEFSNSFKGHSIISTIDGGFAAIGEGSFSSVSDNVLIKFDSQFNIEWSKRLGLNGFSNTGDNLLLLELDNGQFIVAGYRGTLSSRNLQWSLLSSAGDVIWTKYLSLLDLPGETAADLVQLNSNEVILVGTVNSFGAGDSDGMVIKFDLGGNIIFANAIGTSDNDHLYSVEILPNGNFVCSGEVNSDAWLFEMDSNGSLIQTKVLSGSVYTYIMDTEVVNGSLYFTGKSANSLLFGSVDLSFNTLVSKTLANGNIVGSELEYVPSTNQFLITAIQGASFANENSIRVVGMDLNGVVQSLESLGTFVNQQGLIRGQNAVEVDDVFHVISWYNDGINRTVIDRINSCGENDCSVEVIAQSVNSTINFETIPLIINPITGFEDIEFNSQEIDAFATEACVTECVMEVQVEPTFTICSGEDLEINPEFNSNNAFQISWFLNDQYVASDPSFWFSESEAGSYTIEIEASNPIGQGCTSTSIIEVNVETFVAPFVVDPMFACEASLPFPIELYDYQITDLMGEVVTDNFTQSGIYVALMEGACNSEQSSFDVQIENITWPQIESIYYLCEETGQILFEFSDFQIFLNGIELSSPFIIDEAGQYSLELIGGNNCTNWFDFEVSNEFLNTNYFDNLPFTFEDCNFPAIIPNELLEYDWSFNNTPATSAFELPGTYITQVTDVCGIHSYSIEVVQLTFDFPEIISNYIICEGESITINSEDDWNFVESNNELTSIEIFGPGVYSYVLQASNGCTEPLEIAVNEAANETLPFSAICLDDFQIFLDFIDQTSAWSFNENQVLNLMPGTIIVQHSSECGIRNFDFEIIDCSCDVWVPNAFTPNSDNKNEVWKPVFSNPPIWYELKLFNRWGENIYSISNDTAQEWVGDHLSGEYYFVQNEVYNWILKFQCTNDAEVEIKSGFVVLIR